MSDYTNMVAKLNGVLVYQNQDLKVESPNASQRVTTIPGGDVGNKKGVHRTVISFTNAKPYQPSPINLHKAMQDGTEINADVYQEGSSLHCKGLFTVTSWELGQSGPDGIPTETFTIENARSPAPIFQ